MRLRAPLLLFGILLAMVPGAWSWGVPVHPVPADLAGELAAAQRQWMVQAGLVSSEAQLSAPVLLEDLDGDPAAFLYPLFAGAEPVGYVTIAAVEEWAPLIERSGGAALLAALRRCGAELGGAQARLLFLGPFRYVLEASGAEGGVTYLRLPDLAPLSPEQVVSWQLVAEEGLAARAARVAPLWAAVRDRSYFRGKRARKELVATAFNWYRGCGPTTVSMMLHCYGRNGYPNLYEETQRFTWCAWGRTTAKQLHDEVADWCGLPMTSCDYDLYGVTANQMRNSFTSVAGNHGYTFTAQADTTPSYSEYRSEIDEGDPVGIAIYQDGGPSNYDSHAVMGLGYDYGAQHLAVIYDTWDRSAHDYALENFISWNLIRAEPHSPPEETATPTPRPTATPTPRPTATPTPEPSTPTPTPTPTPTAQGTASPTPTPPVADIILDIFTNQDSYSAGLLFLLELTMDNPGPQRAGDLIVILDVTSLGIPGGYYFYPSWGTQMDYERVILPPGERYEAELLRFYWPYGAGSGSGVTFWAVLCVPNSVELLSNIDSTSFSYY
jgi:hypothetical protein